MKKLKAFIFDLDGVITDTSELHFQGWKRLAEEENIHFTRKDNEELRGVSRRKSLEILLKGKVVSEEKKQKMMNKKNNYYKRLIKNISKENLLPGVKKLLGELKERKYKTAIASASKNAITIIKNLGIEDFIDVISDGYSVEKTKPAPDLFQYTAKKLLVNPEECVVIEDAKAGIEAALAANMFAVGIGPSERVGKAHYRYDKIEEMRIDDIISNASY
jgi:beta-phosphoglucomutase